MTGEERDDLDRLREFVLRWAGKIKIVEPIVVGSSIMDVDGTIHRKVSQIPQGEAQVTCETCGGTMRIRVPNEEMPWSSRPKIVPCPDCHCGQQSCCEGAKEEKSEEGS